MKIIGYTSGGYLIEAAPHELATISGQQKHETHESRARYHNMGYTNLPVGTEIKVQEAWDKLQLVMNTTESRAKAARLLRSTADVLEAAIDPIILPEEETHAPAA